MPRHPSLPAWATALLLTATTALLIPPAASAPTWPSPQDELEDIMFLTTGHLSRGFATPITPCGTSSTGDPGRVQAAEWLRTAFHDMASGNRYTGVGGLDASIAYETRSGDNAGPAFNTTLGAYAAYLSARASMADLIALGVYAAVRACGGPAVGVRTGRVDARGAGAVGAVPLPQNSVGTFRNQFDRVGFDDAGMVALVACGHTLGGVHADANPEIVPAGSVADDVVRFDGTAGGFDNRVVTEYLANATQNALVVGRSTTNGRNSDARVFAADGNVTVRAMADPETFSSVCATVLQQMIEVVPSGVTLGEPIAVYEVKPSGMQLTVLDGGESIKLTGDIRVRTTERAASQISKVQLVCKDREGGDGGTLEIESSGSAAGFDDTFEFYGVSANIPSDSSISSFNVLITLTSGETQLYDNDGSGFPVQDSIIFQSPQSCLSGTTLSITAAVRNTGSSSSAAPTLNVTYGVPDSRSVLPVLTASTVAMTKASSSSVGPYDLYTASYTLTSTQLDTARFDVQLDDSTADSFKRSADLSDTCADLSPDPPSTTGAPSSTSSTTTSTAAPPASSSSSSAPVSSSSSTTVPPQTTTTTSTTAPTTPTPTTLSCPSADAAQWTVSDTTFTIHCGKDYQAGQIGVVYASGFEACLAACVAVAADGPCEAVAYVGGAGGGDCYLKNEAAGAVDDEGVWGAVRG
ncbi:wsc domain containing protein [Diplodia corticola]|uniref:Peroxidase n=1 Tax=Diplodia corticola TaxID=236234 RepID=A0A1J9QSI5_9PEZI|nr:wsc domain containing protein [Diplodia corticola]OJD31369.1 wsc domain containing protein [Diplodia corticola]